MTRTSLQEFMRVYRDAKSDREALAKLGISLAEGMRLANLARIWLGLEIDGNLRRALKAKRCLHCGEGGKRTGHQDCQYPQ